jgi:serine/threonine protein kinase
MSQELIGRRVGGWLIHRFLGAGKSAVVFEAERDRTRGALKLFDPELVERFGKATQLARIERERSLIGKHHLHLVQVLDGGECAESGHLYVAMELIDAPHLGSSLTLVPRDKIATILRQIASAARFLEEKGLAHRDIKPDNIAILTDFSRAVLLDLGVLRPFGDSSLTDEDAGVFVGTLRYSSPEFRGRLCSRLESDHFLPTRGSSP